MDDFQAPIGQLVTSIPSEHKDTGRDPGATWRISQFPKDLRETYDETYKLRSETHIEEQRSIAASAFKLLLSLQTPLSHKDFIHALSFCGDNRVTLSAEDLLDLYCNFVVLDTEIDVFRFAHLSVREYLEIKAGYDSESSHALAAQFCLKYLCTSKSSGPFLIPRDACSDSSMLPKIIDVSTLALHFDGRVMTWRTELPRRRTILDPRLAYLDQLISLPRSCPRVHLPVLARACGWVSSPSPRPSTTCSEIL